MLGEETSASHVVFGFDFRYKVLFCYIKVPSGKVEDTLNETSGFIKVRELWISLVSMETHEMQSIFFNELVLKMFTTFFINTSSCELKIKW